MDQESGQPVKPLSVLRGGKKEPAVAAAGSKEGDNDATKKQSRDHSDSDAKVSTLIHNIAHHLIAKTPGLPEFPHKFRVMTDTDGECFVLEENESGEVARTTNTRVGQAVLKFIKDQGYPFGLQKLTHNHMALVVHEFLAVAPRIPEPAMVLELGQSGLTYRRLPFNFLSDPGLVHSPTFAEMMSRTSNAPALMQWIGSIFDPDADMQQYVWLFGGGQNGKSALGRFLSTVLGGGARSVQPPGINDRFWTINLIGKRLVIYGDCNNAKFVTSGLFKSMTGGDAVSAEIKLGATLQIVLKAKHLFFSNKKPGIDGGEADQRRIILCEMGAIGTEPDPFYEDRLWGEAPTFLGECINQYLSHAGPKRRIKADQKAARELAQYNDLEFETVFSCRFTSKEGGITPANLVQRILREEGIRKTEDIKRFKDYVEKNHGIMCLPNSRNCLEYRGMIQENYQPDPKAKEKHENE